MKYSAEITEKICRHLKKGNTITTTCQAVGISKDTFYEWVKKKADFADAIKKAKAIPDKKVENALYKSATMGHKYTEKEYKGVAVGEKVKMILVKTVKKIIPPNITAQIFYLKNRQPGEWKDRLNFDVNGNLNIKVVTAVPRSKKRKENGKRDRI